MRLGLLKWIQCGACNLEKEKLYVRSENALALVFIRFFFFNGHGGSESVGYRQKYSACV
jgi:hypothetical protein